MPANTSPKLKHRPRQVVSTLACQALSLWLLTACGQALDLSQPAARPDAGTAASSALPVAAAPQSAPDSQAPGPAAPATRESTQELVLLPAASEPAQSARQPATLLLSSSAPTRRSSGSGGTSQSQDSLQDSLQASSETLTLVDRAQLPGESADADTAAPLSPEAIESASAEASPESGDSASESLEPALSVAVGETAISDFITGSSEILPGSKGDQSEILPGSKGDRSDILPGSKGDRTPIASLEVELSLPLDAGFSVAQLSAPEAATWQARLDGSAPARLRVLSVQQLESEQRLSLVLEQADFASETSLHELSFYDAEGVLQAAGLTQSLSPDDLRLDEVLTSTSQAEWMVAAELQENAPIQELDPALFALLQAEPDTDLLARDLAELHSKSKGKLDPRKSPQLVGQARAIARKLRALQADATPPQNKGQNDN